MATLQSRLLLHSPIAVLFPIMRQRCQHTTTRGGATSCEIRRLPHLLPQLPLLSDLSIGGLSLKGPPVLQPVNAV